MESEERRGEANQAEEGDVGVGFLGAEFDEAIAGVVCSSAGSLVVVYDASQLLINCYDRGMSGEEAAARISDAMQSCESGSPLLLNRMTPAETRKMAYKTQNGGEDGHQD